MIAALPILLKVGLMIFGWFRNSKVHRLETELAAEKRRRHIDTLKHSRGLLEREIATAHAEADHGIEAADNKVQVRLAKTLARAQVKEWSDSYVKEYLKEKKAIQ